jgi:hypothetical protein
MVKLIILLFSIILLDCHSSQIKNDIDFLKISEYVDLDIELSQDTIWMGDTVSIICCFKNKTNSCYHFHPNALLYADIYFPPEYFTRGANALSTSHYLSSYDDIYNLILLEPYGNYIVTYQIVLNKPLLRRGKNKLIVKYMCSPLIRLQEQEQEQKSKILYGGLQSSPFEIYVKEKEE